METISIADIGKRRSKMEFLTKNADTALIEIKEKLYDRLEILRACMPEDGPIDRLDHQFNNEIEFLSSVLDIIERS